MGEPNLKEIFSSIITYINQLSDYLQKTQNEKYKEILKLEKHIKTAMKSTSDPVNAESAFKWLHFSQMTFNYLERLFDHLNFAPDFHTGEISKTAASHAISQWNDISVVYRLYIRDEAARLSSYSTELMKHVEDLSATQLQKLWSEYPLAVDLYATALTKKLDSAYREGRKEEAAQIMEQLETDKARALGEPYFQSPFLTLGLYPRTSPLPVPAIATLLGIEAKTLDTLKSQIQESKNGLIIIYREQPVNHIMLRPPITDMTRGLITDDVKPILQAITTSRWNWKTKIWGKDRANFICLESIGNLRILTPWAEEGPYIVPRSYVFKILKEMCGRPHGYFGEQDQTLMSKLKPSVRILAQHELTDIDYAPNRSRIINKMMDAYNNSSDKLNDPAVWKAWQTAMLAEMKEERNISSLLYLIHAVERQFKKDIQVAIKRENPENSEMWLEKNLSKLLADIFAQNVEIYKILKRKQFINDQLSAESTPLA